MRDAGLARLRHQRLAERLQGFALVGVEKPERNATGPCLMGRHDDFNAADCKCQSARGRAFYKAAPSLSPPGVGLFVYREGCERFGLILAVLLSSFDPVSSEQMRTHSCDAKIVTRSRAQM